METQSRVPEPSTGGNQPKNHRLVWIIVFLVLAVAIVISAYFMQARPMNKSKNPAVPVTPVSPGAKKPAPAKKPLATQSKAVPLDQGDIHSVNTAFGFNLLHQLLADEADGESGKNIFISPTSIALALDMVYNGAAGETKEAMADALGLKGIDLASLNQANSQMIEKFNNLSGVELAIANSIWSRQGMTVREEYMNNVEKIYQAQISSLDFSDPDSAATINSWVSKKTKDKIQQIVQRPLPDDTAMFLINAIYFKGDWKWQFDEALTKDRKFKTATGDKSHPFMSQDGEFSYWQDNDVQLINLPYGEKEDLSMIVALPKKGLDTFVRDLDEKKWKELAKNTKMSEGTIIMPKFRIEYEKDLNGILGSLGMGVAFTSQADFTGMREVDDLFISKVKHKTFVEVNEKGTEAAAVTSVQMMFEAVVQEPEKFIMEVNRPFLFAIVDNKTGEMLFVGLVREPDWQ